MSDRISDNREGHADDGSQYAKSCFHRSIVSCFVILASIVLFTQTGVATGEEHGAAGHGPGMLHIVVELLQLLIGIVAVGAAIAGTQTMRGGHMETAFYSLTAGVIIFLLQRMWHSASEFGIVVSLPGTVEQVLFLTATGLMGLGFLLVYRIMN